MTNIIHEIKCWWNSIDKFILFSTIFLITIGFILVFSASQITASKYGWDQNYLLKKHIIFSLSGIFVILCLTTFSIKNLIILCCFTLVISTILSLAAVLFFPELKGASRWIKLFDFSFQPSEFFKPSFIVVSSLLLNRYKNKEDNSLIFNIIILVVISSILLIQPDFGMFLLLVSIWFLNLLITQINIKVICLMLLSFVITFLSCYFLLEHVQFRINNFFFKIGDNYQISKSLDSIQNGGLFGKGIGQSEISKNLPDVHSDFIFALAVEELGMIFVFLILLVYVSIYFRIYIISLREKNFFVFSSLFGLSSIFILQTLINISSSLNLLPTKGMTLPFISYGGSSMISCSIIVGLLLSLTKKRNE